MIMGNQIEHILLQVGACAGYRMNFIPSDHLGQRYSEFGGTHCPTHCQQHFSVPVNMIDISFRGISNNSGIKMPEISFDKFFYRLKI
ncbi:MAG: hypothetical protein BWY90_01086 [Deltaproteobacteria bacterium ADurb.BinA014]|nr:MAG: hypothetical protein BWY90_01086 [Deltaproteobacteria bacterium ADurb.BinA014]